MNFQSCFAEEPMPRIRPFFLRLIGISGISTLRFFMLLDVYGKDYLGAPQRLRTLAGAGIESQGHGADSDIVRQALQSMHEGKRSGPGTGALERDGEDTVLGLDLFDRYRVG